MNAYQKMFSILDYRIVSYFTEACIGLKVFDHLAARPLPLSELAKITNTNERALYRCLRGLSHFDLLKEEEETRIFSLTETSNIITSGSEFSLIPWHTFSCLAQGSQHQKRRQLWQQLLRTGKSIYQIGRSQLFYDYLREHQDIASAFDQAMESMSRAEIRDILENVDFSSSSHITEVAGGSGTLISGILKRNLTMRGQLCDFPDVVDRVDPTERLEISAVNMHESLTEIPGDVIVKRILHSYSDETAGNILRNIGNAMSSGNRLYVFELVEENAVQNPYVGIKNLQMLLVHGAPGESGGPGERTKKEFSYLLNSSGFELIQSQNLASIDMVTAIKN